MPASPAKRNAVQVRWKEASELAEHLLLPKKIVFDHILPELRKDNVRYAGMFEGDAESKAMVIEWIKQQKFYTRACNPELRIADPDEQPTYNDTNTVINSRGEKLTTADQIKLALWFIDKVAGPDNAEKIMSIACESHRKLGRK